MSVFLRVSRVEKIRFSLVSSIQVMWLVVDLVIRLGVRDVVVVAKSTG